LNLQVRLDGRTVWLTQRMIAELYQVSVKTVNEHLVNIYDEQELDPEATIRKFRIVQLEGNRNVTRTLDHYSLDAILAVGYRVRSHRGTQFRQWATSRLGELLIKGFTLDDERIKAGRTIGQDYFDELLERIRDIRASERLFFQKITDIYATSIDYDPKADISRSFFATVQDKLHWAIHGHTAAEIIADRADSTKPHMGLSTWKNAPGGPIRKVDVTVAKNYLSEMEIKELNRIVTMYLDYAEDQAQRQRKMHMADWNAKLDAFLQFNERNILTHAGKITHELALEHAEGEFEKYRTEQRRLKAEQPVSDFDRIIEQAKQIERTSPKDRSKAPSKRTRPGGKSKKVGADDA
ncbi:MAG: virulence RhuM family protein, partial [Pseudomonadota bacterium]